MLYEIEKVDQKLDEYHCRWFADYYFDLFVWYNSDKTIHGFQLCYDKNFNECALSWWQKGGFSHMKVDSGDRAGRTAMSPILIPIGISEQQEIINKFQNHAKNLDQSLVDFIVNKLLTYGNKT
jgi:hypothetical protein